MRLMREIRFSVGSSATGAVLNSWGGWPAASGIQPFVVLRAWVEGDPDLVTGYICNIKLIDRALRERAIPLVSRFVREPLPVIIRAISTELFDASPTGTHWTRWELAATPYLRFAMNTLTPDTIEVTQSFEFSASHRLHAPSLSEQENRAIFGKCNNPNGHGHNYIVEVTLAGQSDAAAGVLTSIEQFERTVKEQVIDRLDHKHLNTDCPEFANLNPSVENITRVIWSLLEGRFAPARLARVRVWETAKTYAEHSG